MSSNKLAQDKLFKGKSGELPIHEVVSELKQALTSRHEAVLEAPPGAGKTTQVPLALLQETWLGKQKIVMLEPRRLAARAAAERMAALLGEKVGQTVGYRVRLDKKVSAETKIEVVTEGILTRMLQNDPSLEGIGLLIFDEFHERSLDGDLALAFSLQGRELFRDTDPLKILVMSATLDGQSISILLNDAPLIRSEGRQFPVAIHYGLGCKLSEPWLLIKNVVQSVVNALKEHRGSVLVFLPGQGEISRVQRQLEELFNADKQIIIAPLYGNLKLEEQRLAISPAPEGQRKVVLATSIAESSLTIEGITMVVDSGLSRQAVFDPATGMTRLETKRLSKASSEQRKGRAGRLQPGTCYRLWSEEQQSLLSEHATPEILQADLAPLALQLIRWGDEDLSWLDKPPLAALAQAKDLLRTLGAIDTNHQLSESGEHMANLPLHPRLAYLLWMGARFGLKKLACDIAAILSERDFIKDAARSCGADLQYRLEVLAHGGSGVPKAVLHRLRQQSQQFFRLCSGIGEQKNKPNLSDEQSLGFLLACAYPDRIAQRYKEDHYRLSNGRTAKFTEADSLRKNTWLVVANVLTNNNFSGAGKQNSGRIVSAVSFDHELLFSELRDSCTEQIVVEWDDATERFIAEKQVKMGQLIVKRESLDSIPKEKKQQVLLSLLKKRGLQLLPWTNELRQWQARVLLLRASFNEAASEAELVLDDQSTDWPDVSDSALLETLNQWLLPYLDNVNHINHFSKLDLKSVLQNILPWPLPQQLNELAPEKITVPSGSVLSIDYTQSPPVLAVRLQEMLGCAETPKIAQGRVSLMLHLLSPARRPLQVTQDLSSFWQNAYTEVKKDMKGRYPKHHWPDDPMTAHATARVKPRSPNKMNQKK